MVRVRSTYSMVLTHVVAVLEVILARLVVNELVAVQESDCEPHDCIQTYVAPAFILTRQHRSSTAETQWTKDASSDHVAGYKEVKEVRRCERYMIQNQKMF